MSVDLINGYIGTAVGNDIQACFTTVPTGYTFPSTSIVLLDNTGTIPQVCQSPFITQTST